MLFWVGTAQSIFLFILSLKSHLCKSQVNSVVLKIDFKVPWKKALHIFDGRELQMMIMVHIKDYIPKMPAFCFGRWTSEPFLQTP